MCVCIVKFKMPPLSPPPFSLSLVSMCVIHVYRQIECVKMIVASSAHLAACRTSFLNALGKAVLLTNEQTSSHENVATRIHDLKVQTLRVYRVVVF